MTLEEKIDFLLEYVDSDKIEWDSCLGDVDFLFDFGKKNFKYIFHSIYEPLMELILEYIHRTLKMNLYH